MAGAGEEGNASHAAAEELLMPPPPPPPGFEGLAALYASFQQPEEATVDKTRGSAKAAAGGVRKRVRRRPMPSGWGMWYRRLCKPQYAGVWARRNDLL